MDCEDLRAFRATVEHGSFAAAARALGVARPGVSRRVARLERRLAVTLLVRSTRKVEPTPAGRLLCDGVVEMAAVWDTTVEAVYGGPDARPPRLLAG